MFTLGWVLTAYPLFIHVWCVLHQICTTTPRWPGLRYRTSCFHHWCQRPWPRAIKFYTRAVMLVKISNLPCWAELTRTIYCLHTERIGVLLVQPDAHVVGVPLLAGVAQGGVELDHLVVAVEGDLAHHYFNIIFQIWPCTCAYILFQNCIEIVTL